MFKNLKEKVKNNSSSDQFSIVHKTPTKQHSQTSRSKSTSNTDDTKSNLSIKITDDDHHSTLELENDLIKPQAEEISPTYTNEYEVKNSPETSQVITNLESNENIDEKNKIQKFNESLLSKIEILNNEIKQKEIEINNYKVETKTIYENLDEYRSIFENFELTIKNLQEEKEKLIIKNAELSQKYELLKIMNQKQESSLITQFSQSPIPISSKKSISTDKEIATSVNELSDFIQVNYKKNDSFEGTDKLLEENKILRTDLSEKNKMIKNLQQRLNDMKKALKKELNSHSDIRMPADKINEQNLLHTSASTNSLKSNSSSNLKSYSTNSSFPTVPKSCHLMNYTHGASNEAKNLTSLHEDVNFKYLKHVVFKFLCSRENEALHLVKALSVLLNFSNDEEKVLKETLEWKMSWFGTRPKIQ